MSNHTLHNVQHYEPAPPTNASLEYADLCIIDFSKADTEEGRAALAGQVKKGLRNQGFLYIVNFGYTQEEVKKFHSSRVLYSFIYHISTQTTRMFDIADVHFSCVPDDEKRKYATKMFETGSEAGFKLRKYWATGDGIPDQIEQYCYHRVDTLEHPEALRPLLPEIDKLCKYSRFNVLHTLLRLIARSLELPKDTLVNKHNWDRRSDSAVKFIKVEKALIGVTARLQNHNDFMESVVTKFYHSHVIKAVQVINLGDAMEFLTGGYHKAMIHRVVQPPEDQRQYSRLGSYYIARAGDDVKLVPLVESPVLQREGIERRCEDSHAPTMIKWGRDRTKAFGKQGIDEVTISAQISLAIYYHLEIDTIKGIEGVKSCEALKNERSENGVQELSARARYY
ncbi:Clavaminate synthase-like protein [Rhizopogon vinicolor AM-OR11-026]|uniref:Clavaminate synthase-like protein n=1 Tax=Rhizopogon vinicolor AM-OR11-026 TaxID=1314800 RepID=A0A1B7N1K2_9AGAM|nr:Clavaminate synthase-like protein [Rhizopogon vinicolor AM-OR11-026]